MTIYECCVNAKVLDNLFNIKHCEECCGVHCCNTKEGFSDYCLECIYMGEDKMFPLYSGSVIGGYFEK